MPRSLEIPPTEMTPAVHFDALSCTLTIEGESYPEDVVEFYAPIESWLDESLEPGSRFTFALKLWYLNTGSTKALIDLLSLLTKKQSAGGKIDVVWYHLRDLELMREAGEELLSGCPLPHRIETLESPV